jgi:hypothetical protein
VLRSDVAMGNVRVFRTSRTKAFFLFAGSALFVWVGLYVAGSRPLLGWATAVFAGACTLLGLVTLVTGGASLRLDEQGFKIAGVLRTSGFRWVDIESIRMAKIRGASIIALDYRKGDPRRSQVSRALAGMDATVGNIYGISIEDLCAVMKEWHERYGSAGLAVDGSTTWEQAGAAAKCAVEQFKSKLPVDAICPACKRVIDVTYVEPPSDSFVTKCECQRSNRIFRGVMGPPGWILAERDRYLTKAAGLGVLDATFYATYFNESKSGEYFECPIDPRSLSPEASDDVMADAIRRSRRLHHGMNAFVGSAYFKYPGEQLTYEDAVQKLKRDNPGFCEDAYDSVIRDSIQGMR